MAAFFVFGALMSGLASLSLAFAGGPLEPMWRINPTAHEALAQMGGWAVILMATVCLACAFSAVSLWNLWYWGYLLAIGVLIINLFGDTLGAIVRGDPVTLIGLPIGGTLIWYLARPSVRAQFVKGADA
jgi:hypothetical protein